MVLVGTDTKVPWELPGFSLHDKLESLAKLNFSKEQLIQAATVASANFMKTNRKNAFCLILLLFSLMAIGQKTVRTISGQLLDKETAEPIAFASIYLKGKAIGTISNDEGYFVFHIPPIQKGTPIVISAMGYISLEKNPDSFLKDSKLYLSSQINQLDEVQITATKKKTLTAKEIVKKAYDEIGENYPSNPYILEGFVRDLQKEDNRYVAYLECAAKFYHEGFRVKREPQVELVGVKTSFISEKHPWNENSERKNSIIDLVEDDFIRFDYGPITGKKGWKYEIDCILPYDNRLVYRITGVDKPFQTSTLYIDSKTFAFVRMELTRQAIDNRSWRRRFTNGALQVYYNVIFEYQEYKGKMYLKYQKEEDIWRIFKGLESKKLLFTQYPKKELFINNIIVENIKEHPFKSNMDIGTSIENQLNVYDEAFWATYNVPQKTAEQSKLIQELENRID